MFERLSIPTIAPCPIGLVLEDLDNESRDNLETALASDNRTVPHAAIARAIRAELDRAVDPYTVSRHRAGECRCSSK
jgi:hypothetical protein